MKFPEEVRVILTRKYKTNYRDWLNGIDEWPLSISLSPPTEKDVQVRLQTFKSWIDAWKAWPNPSSVVWKDFSWRNLGVQSLPVRVNFDSPTAIASIIGETDHWNKCVNRRSLLEDRWPQLRNFLERSSATNKGPTLDDLQMLISVLDWLENNPQSNLYPRQVPIPGIDSKWVENHIPLLVAGLTSPERKSSGLDFYALSGLKRPPRQIRIRILDPDLRSQIGGLSDLHALPEEIAKWDLPIQKTYIVENLQTGLALEDIDGAVVFMALGNGVEVLSSIPWISKSKCIYWGDIDTYGFFILDQLRSYYPNTESILMDESTLEFHRDLWTDETKQHPVSNLTRLTTSEKSVFEGLRAHRWQSSLRLEQERILWDYAWKRISAVR